VLLLGGLRKQIGAQDCSPLVNPARVVPVRTHAVSPGKGTASVSVHIPNDPSLQGRVFHAQWILIDPAGSPQKATRVLAVEIQ